MRLMMRWSPISSVFSMEPDGMTRAWPTVPLISKKIRMTQNQAIISRHTFCCVVSFSSGCVFFCLAFMRHRNGSIGLYCGGVLHSRVFHQLSVGAAFANFELHKVRGIVARITRRAKRALGVVYCLAQSGK